MRSAERHQLKQDQFAVKTQETIDWASAHQNALLYWTLAVVVIVALGVGGFYYQQRREQAASVLLGEAIEQYSAPIVPAGTPATPGYPSFYSTAERAKAASQKFADVSDKYSHTDAGTLAKYFLGLTYEDLNDNTRAEQQLKEAVSAGNKDTAALAKAALASLYENTGREQDAINEYKELVDKPANTVPKSTAQLKLAELYQAKNPVEAKKIYADIIKDKDSPEAAVKEANARMLAPK